MRNNQNRLGEAGPDESPAPAAPSLNFAVPTEFVELPSKGKFYSSDHPLHNQETVEIKYMTAKEEDILSSTALLKKGLAIDRLLESIMVPTVDPRTLLVGDRNAIMIAARISAYGSAYHAHTTCGNCLTRQEHAFDLQKVGYNLECFDQDVLEKNGLSYNDEKRAFEYVLPKSGTTVLIKIPTGFDEVREDDKEESSAITTILTRLIVAVEDNSNRGYVANFVNSMLAWDSRALRAVLPLTTPNVNLEQDVTCRFCAHTETKEVPLTAEFFWPR
mgnify:CR=1 FL=1|tara:strand:- start:1098 stop:1919 length:822 start_codon:yes stop_codon:yes gene_type:complete